LQRFERFRETRSIRADFGDAPFGNVSRPTTSTSIGELSGSSAAVSPEATPKAPAS
jgi:hypothetical protein